MTNSARALLACALLACAACQPTASPSTSTAADDTAAEDTAPADTAAADTAAEDTAAEDSAPADTAAEDTAAPACATRLFGRPSAKTGLSDDQCGPSCGCGAEEKVGLIPTEAQIAYLLTLTTDPLPALDADPYAAPAPAPTAGDAVCGVTITGSAYTLATYEPEALAQAAGAVVTHGGPCGLCSPLQDLAVYMRYPDLTEPVRACGLLTFQEGDEAGLACIRDLGFTEPCAQIWFYNTRHTREVCLAECLRLLSAPYHTADGSLNACILCDEVKSGDVFKAVAGRTRRNTGLPSALCRPCDEVRALPHDYGAP